MRADRKPTFAVLGAGALGLTAALRLARDGHSVTVYEREPLPGGLASGFKVNTSAGAVWLEKFYHHLFRTDRSAIALIGEVGLASSLRWHRPRTVTLRGGRTHQLDSALSLLRFSPLPLLDRFRMGAVLALLRATPRASPFEGKTAAAWTRRWMGAAAYGALWEPLLHAKFGDAADEVAMAWLWARIHDRTAELGYLDGGFQQLYDTLSDAITAAGGRVELSTEVTRIGRRGGGLTVATRRGPEADERAFDRVLSTLPTRLTCRLAPDLPDSYRERYEWGRAYGAHCLLLALDRPLTDAYWMNVADGGYPFMAVVEHTNMRASAEYGGRHLVYLANYRAMDDPLFTQTSAETLEAYAPHLRRINSAFDVGWISESWTFSAPFAQPIVTTAYREHIPPFATPVPGLFVANMFQVYPHDRGQNYSIELADRFATRMRAQSSDAAVDAVT